MYGLKTLVTWKRVLVDYRHLRTQQTNGAVSYAHALLVSQAEWLVLD